MVSRHRQVISRPLTRNLAAPLAGVRGEPEYDWPSALNTGALGALTAYAGPETITVNDTIIEDKDIAVMLTINPGVTGVIIRRSRITTGNFYCINGDSAPPFTVEDCTLIGSGPEGGVTNAAILGPVSAERCNISDCENGIVTQPGAALIKFNYIHDLASSAAEPHYDGIHALGGETDLLIEDNRIASDDTSCINFQNTLGGFDNITINHNYCTGADSLIRLKGDDSVAPVTDVFITNNVLGPAIFQIDIVGATATVTGNEDEDGNPVP